MFDIIFWVRAAHLRHRRNDARAVLSDRHLVISVDAGHDEKTAVGLAIFPIAKLDVFAGPAQAGKDG